MVVQAAQHFFAAASSLEAEEVGLGQLVLSLLPHDAQVQQQGQCLKALQELQDYGLHLLPADYAQVHTQLMPGSCRFCLWPVWADALLT